MSIESIIEKIRAKTPLKTKIRVKCEMSFIDLLTELGYREDKAWTPDEDEKLNKLIKSASKLTDDIMELIKKENK